MSLRIGHGFDAHRFVPSRPLMLGCIHIDYERGLLGHSDGDAVAHALADAVLGGAGLGDIGGHFPSGDERWQGTAGGEFLERVAAELEAAHGRLISAQVIAICEEPRLSPHLDAMSAAMCRALGVPPGSVTVSATTTDGMDAAGRGEGVFASAVALLDCG